jgi:tetratricopeptide (TPR) repeat protein
VIVGTVHDQAGQSIDGIRVSVFDENFQPIRTLFVDSAGTFTIRGLSSGIYTFRIETAGRPYEEQTQRIELQALRIRTGGQETYPLNFTLKAKKPVAVPPPRAELLFAQDVPVEARNLYEKATEHLHARESELAFAALRKALDIFPDYFAALELLGIEHVKQQRYRAALPLLDRALQVNARAPKTLYAGGVALLKLDYTVEATKWLESATALEPRNANTQMMLGLAYRGLGAWAAAIEALRKSLHLTGGTLSEAHFYLADIYEKQSNYRLARTELEQYLKTAKPPKNPAEIKRKIEAWRDKK